MSGSTGSTGAGPTLTLLTTTQMSNYITSLNLSQGTQAYACMNTLLLLDPTTFARAISALAGGLITFSQIQSLPAVNANLVNALINTQLGASYPGTIQFNYMKLWVPASIDFPALQAAAIGSVPAYVAARSYDFWGSLIKPNYDFTGATPTSYISYNQALTAYLGAANAAEANSAVSTFQEQDAAFAAAWPALAQAEAADRPVLQAILSLQTAPYFLENPQGGRTANEILDLLASAAYRNVSPYDFRQFMETVAYPAMAAEHGSDSALSGSPGAIAVQQATGNQFGPLPPTGVEWALDLPSMAQVYLPQAYGTEVLSAGEIAANQAQKAALVGYLDDARVALLTVLEAVQNGFPADASQDTLTGTPMGLTLLFTYT